MKIKQLTTALEAWAPRGLQEDYDNSGLHVGDPEAEVTGSGGKIMAGRRGRLRKGRGVTSL